MALKTKTKPKPKPAYSPQTEQEITQSMFNLALAGPRWIGEQMGEDLDEAFEIGETRVSLSELIRHPIKTVKGLAKAWTISSWKNTLSAELVAEYVWKPRLEHFKTQGKIDDDEFDFILEKWAEKPEGSKRDEGFERLEELHKYGHLDDDVWQGIQRQHQWDEFSQFRRKPGRYVWEKLFGKRGHLGEGRFYKYSPQKWLGEPLGKALGATRFGRVVAGIRQSARVLLGQVVDKLKVGVRAAGRLAIRGAKWVVTKVAGAATWASISATVAAALGTAIAPGVGTAIGFLAGPVVFKTAEWIIKISCLTCGCATLMFAGSMIALLVSVFGAFRPPEMGGGVEERIVRLNKIAAPSRVELAATKPIVDYEIRFVNESDGELTSVVLVDRYDKNNFTPFALGGATNDAVNGTLTWNLGTIGPAGDGWVAYDGFINASDGVDKIVMNTATLTATTTEGENVSATAIGIVIVGNPSGQPPSGWPTAKGCVTQGPGGSYSHTGADAVDVGKLAGEESETYKVYATHDGVAYAWVGPDGPLSSAYGKYVEVVSHGGTFRTYYCHLFSHSIATGGVAVDRGSELGVMGATGSTDGGVHVHYEFRGVYENEPLDMEPPYIPSEIGSCSGRAECGCCFTSREARCGQ